MRLYEAPTNEVSMDLSKLKLGQKIVLGAGILVIINLFLPW